MKTNALSLALFLAAAAAPLLPTSARAEVEVSFDFFQDSLSPYGEWLDVEGYGNCWRPTGVGEDWSPYTDGYWSFTDAGWTWVSYEDWGDITYHYGRWTRISDEGWCWVPDTEWGPAWVSWRSNDDYVGWAPLPPEARFERDRGFSVWVDTSYDIGPDYYRFCHTRDFGAPVLQSVCLPRSRNVTIIENTVNITNITYNRRDNCVFNGGPNYGRINRLSARPIPALKLVRETNVNVNVNVNAAGGRGRGFRAVQRGNQLTVVAPRVVRPTVGAPTRIQPTRVIPANRVNRGWANVSDPAQRQAIQRRIQQQNKGVAATTPARPVRPQDLAVLPKKADPNAPSPVNLGRGRGKPGGNLNAAEVAQRPTPQAPPPADASTANPPAQPPPSGPAAPPQPTVTAPEQNARPGRPERPEPVAPQRPAVVQQPPAPDAPSPGATATPPERPAPGNRARPGVAGRAQPTPARDEAAIAEQRELRRQQREQAIATQKQQQEVAAQAASARRTQQQQAVAERRQQQAEAGRPQPQQNVDPAIAAARQQARQQQAEAARSQPQRNVDPAAAAARQQAQQQQAEVARRRQENASRATEARRAQQQENAAARADQARQQQTAGAARQQQAIEMQRAAQVQRQAAMQQQRRQAEVRQQQAQQRPIQPQVQRQPQAQRPAQAQPRQPAGEQRGRGKKLTPEEAAKLR